jgi:tetratricopeptide (TPR) repeat protein
MADVSPTCSEAAADAGEPDVLPSGTRIGRYAISSVLGHGGMGRVYEAWDLRLERRIALKLLRPEVFKAGHDGQLRMLREARALARVTHPNVVPVFDVGRFGGRIYVAMEHVQGQTLRTFIATPRDPATVLDVFVPIARGLLAVHEMGLVHRDFKPGNVILGTDGRPRVMDFGLARGGIEPTSGSDRDDTASTAALLSSPSGRISSGDPLETALTVAGTVVGTPPYMAPEQHAGQPIDARADQYAFCVALWEALFGRRPFQAADAESLARLKASGAPAPPEEHDVPRWLVALLRRGLAVRPEERFASMRELLDALERGRRPARGRAAWLVGAVAILGAAAWLRPGDTVPREPGVITDPAAQAIGDANATVAAIRTHLVSADAHGRLGEFADALREARVALDMARELEHPPIIAEARIALGKAMNAHGDPAAAAEQLRQAAWTAEAAGDDAVVASACAELVRLLATAAPDFAEADRWARVGAAAIERGRLDDASRLRLVHAVAVLDLQRDALDRAEAGFREVLAHEQVKPDPDSARVAFALSDVARVAARRGDLVEARALGDRALDLLETALGPDHPELADVLVFVGGLATTGGDFEASIAMHRRALAIRTATFAPDHPAIAHALGPLAWVLGTSGALEEALPLQQRELSILEAALGPDHADCGVAHSGLGITFDRLGRHEDAARHMRRALEIGEMTAGPVSAPVATAHNNLAISLERLGRRDDARTHYERSVEIHEAVLGPDHPEIVRALANLAWLDHLDGNDTAARARLERAVTLLDVPGRPDDRELAMLLLDLGELSLEGGDDVRARAAVDRLVALGTDKLPERDRGRVDELRARI